MLKKEYRKEINRNIFLFMAFNIFLGLVGAVSIFLNGNSVSINDAISPEAFFQMGMGIVELGEVMCLLMYLVLFAVPIALGTIIYRNENIGDYIFLNRPKIWLTVGGIFGIYAINYVCTIFPTASNLFFSARLIGVYNERFTFIQGLIFFFIVVVAPAFLEELTFRGFILGRLSKYNKVGAVLVSSLLFSLMHMTVEQIPFALLAGLLLGYIYLRTKSIWSVIIIHGFNNLFAFIETLVVQYSFDENFTYAVFTCISAFLFLIGFVFLLIMAFTHKTSEDKGLIPGAKGALMPFIVPSVIISILICVFVTVAYMGVF